MKKFNLFMTILIVIMLVTGCNNQNHPSINVKFLNEGQIFSTEEFHSFSVQVSDKNLEKVDAEKVYFYMNMEMMNHPIEGTMEEVDAGKYEIKLPLAMAGDWYVNVLVTIGGETIVFKDFSIIAEGPKQLEWMKGYNADNN